MDGPKKRTQLNKDDALTLMQKYCAYQERSHSEVRTRLIEHSVYGDDLEEVISQLIMDDFLNEERFARAYARGKFRIKKWGRNKILKELKFRRVSDYSIRKAMTEIDEEEYYSTLHDLIRKKIATIKSKNQWDKRKKLTSYATQKGYEYGLIKEVLKELVE